MSETSTSRCRVLGVVMARNEWPILALSVSHALLHVDRVLVIDHSSTDDTVEGLSLLSDAWGDRIEVIRIQVDSYWQEATTNLAIEYAEPDRYDWVYVFDADEFLITAPGTSLQDVLTGVPEECTTARYEVENWVAPYDFVDTDLEQYLRLRHRSLANVFIDLPGPLLRDEIEHDNLNFFDIPFQSKVIVRTARSAWIAAGAHSARAPASSAEGLIAHDKLHVAHLPFLGRRRLQMRVARGSDLVEAGFPPDHEWQSQMISRLAEEGRIDEFWARHSIGSTNERGLEGLPTVVEDDHLAEALTPTIRRIGNLIRCNASTATSHRDESHVDELLVPVSAALRATRTAQRLLEVVAFERDNVRRERGALVGEHGTLLTMHRNLLREHEALAGAHQTSVREYDALAAAHHESIHAHESLVERHLSLAQEHDALAAAHHESVYEYNSLAARHLTLVDSHDTLISAHEALARERDTLAARSEQLLGECEGLVDERDRFMGQGAALLAELEAMRRTLTWRVSQPFRAVSRRRPR